ncbi:cysteine desulfurase [Microbacterium sp. zg.B48]|uniref:cysteine desulfurase family protein n=1 Tax=Microbacterium sp. zg.B48 TaxID=2969408 RepID=UPI00214D0B99|nr:cysteine desulfurase family protein [Microbacterium sp. zg.B48]MCR2763703.1 cysteine desulfurase [Microbacterium sp. zg.B48]
MVVYVDHAATTPLRAEAREAWLAATETVGNASSIHSAGQSARRLLEESRERLAAALDCDPVEVVFTSGGTESVNLGITGLYRARRESTGRNAIVAPLAEHHATLDTLGWLHAHEVADIEWVPVDRDARVDLDAWGSAVGGGDAAAATLLAANNEVGSLQPLVGAAAAAAEADVPVHVDAVGAFGHVPLSFRGLRAQSGSGSAGLVAMSVAAHKLGGPVGVGALVVAREARVEPLLHGGGQQRGLRAGTQDAAGAAAFAVAAELAVGELAAESTRIRSLRDRLESGLRARIPHARVSAAAVERLPGHLHVVFPGAQGDSLLLLLDTAGIAVSTGSACQAGVPEPSHVVRAMGLGESAARSALRLTLGRTTTDADVDAVLDALPAAFERARAAGLSSRRVPGSAPSFGGAQRS